MKWQDRAVQLRETHSWTETYKQIRKEYPRLDKTDGQIRDAVRWRTRNKSKPKEPVDIHETLKKLLQKEQQLKQLIEATRCTERMVLAAIEDLKEQGIQIIETDGKYKICKDIVPQENRATEDWQGNRIIRFGAVSDTHLCSKWQQLTHLNTMYDIFEQEGIETVYHAGDITEGVNMRRGHEYEVFKHGTDEQQQYVIDNYPRRPGIVTKFITGNHDHSGIKAAGHDIGYPIERARDDMVYLGMSNAKIELTPNCVLELNHALDGSAYALSYAIQKRIDAMSGGEKPSILIDGHHHKMIYLFYRNIHAFEAATFQAQTAFMRGKRLPAHMGGWIYQIHVDDEGTIQRCGAEFFPFYKAIENDY